MNIKTLSVFCLLLIQGQLFAQFNPSDYGKSFDCTIIFKSGETKKLYAKYSHPGILMGTNPLETNTAGNIDKGLIETFYMNNQCWVQRSTPAGMQWVILNRQGAIEHITYITTAVKTSSAGTDNFTPVTSDLISKNGQSETNASLVLGYKKKMSQLVSDYAELAGKVANEEKGYGFITYLDVVDEYNAWFEKNNPGKIKYYPWFRKNGKGGSNTPTLGEVKQAIKETKDSVANAKKEFAASRPATVAAEIASLKPNLPPKKEAFTAKIKRYEADGHKIAVVMQDQKTRLFIGAGGIAGMKDPKIVGFEGAMEAEFVQPGILDETVAELNKVYGTTIFTAVQQIQIPLKQIKNMPADDWWSTCYKTVVSLSHIRQFSCNTDMLNEGDFEGSGSLGLYANVFEYTDNGGKQDTDVLKRLYNLGFGNSDSFKYKKADGFVNFEILDTKIDWNKVKQRYTKKRQDQFAKLVEKWD